MSKGDFFTVSSGFSDSRDAFALFTEKFSYSVEKAAGFILTPFPRLIPQEFLAWVDMYNEYDYLTTVDDQERFLVLLKTALRSKKDHLSPPWVYNNPTGELRDCYEDVVDFGSAVYLETILMFFRWQKENSNILKDSSKSLSSKNLYGPDLLEREPEVMYLVPPEKLFLFNLFEKELQEKRDFLVGEIAIRLKEHFGKNNVLLLESFIFFETDIAEEGNYLGELITWQKLYCRYIREKIDNFKKANALLNRSLSQRGNNGNNKRINQALVASLISYLRGKKKLSCAEDLKKENITSLAENYKKYPKAIKNKNTHYNSKYIQEHLRHIRKNNLF